MADNNIIIIETDPEQMIAKNGCRNIKQFDIQTGGQNDFTILGIHRIWIYRN